MRNAYFQSVVMIRKFLPEDKQFYIECSKEFYSSPVVIHDVSEDNFAHTFNLIVNNSPNVYGVILEHDGVKAGYGIMSECYSNEVGGSVLWLEELFILPEFRSKGLATSYFQYVKANFGDKVKRFRLEVTKSNARAVRLYERMGFQPLDYLQMHIDI